MILRCVSTAVERIPFEKTAPVERVQDTRLRRENGVKSDTACHRKSKT